MHALTGTQPGFRHEFVKYVPKSHQVPQIGELPRLGNPLRVGPFSVTAHQKYPARVVEVAYKVRVEAVDLRYSTSVKV